MPSITVPGPSLLYVDWSCRRCGTTGVARTTVPVGEDWGEALMRVLLDSLRRKLVRKHQAQRCIATVDDFQLGAHAPTDRPLAGRI